MISLLFGVPISVRLSDRDYVVRPYRLIDLARLEAWALSRIEGPTVLIELALSSDDPSDRADWLRRASDAADHVPVYGSDQVRAILTTIEGVAYQLRLGIVRPRRRRLSVAAADELARNLTTADWLRFSRVAYGLHPLDEVSSYIDFEIGAPPSESNPMTYRDWRGMIKSAMEAGILPHIIPKLPLRLWDAAVYGKDGAHPIAEPDEPDPEYWQEVSEARGKFWKGWQVDTTDIEDEA